MQTIRIQLPKPHTGQAAVLAGMKRFNVLACGRRWGKTEFLKDQIVHPLLKGKPVGYFASQYRYLDEVWAALSRTLAPLTKYRNGSNHRLELITGGVLDMWTLNNPDAGRSRKYARAVVDEAGLQPGLKDIWFRSIRPTLMDMRGDSVFAGSPNGLNDFYDLFNMSGLEPDLWASWQLPTHNNPHIHPDELEAARRDMPERRYREEILAEFLDDGTGVFRYVREARYGDKVKRMDDLPQGDYVIGVDLGKLHDYTVFMVVERSTRRVVWFERMQSDYTVQIEKLVSLYQRLNPTALVIEDNVGQMFIEQARARGLQVRAFTTTSASKTRIIENLAVAFERGDILIPDDDTLVNELLAFEAERLPSGAMRYAAPTGYHDDMVMALALAWDAITSVVKWNYELEAIQW